MSAVLLCALAARGLLLLAVAAALAGLLRPVLRPACARTAALALAAATLVLAGALLADAFELRVVWLYSAPELPWYLKLANLWGGDEGVLLVLATLLGALAPGLVRQPGWAGAGALAGCAFLGLGALLWDPFAATTHEQLARAPFQGMNAHLVRAWMAFHPPFLLLAYALFLAPAGAALEALRHDRGPWATLAARRVRLGWLTLTLGLALGMWWAYEDFTFGQIWHWDPVQTSVFAVWALATAHLHCLRAYRPGGRLRLCHPLLGLATALAALLSLAVTRSPLLASSHRYVGATSLPWWLLAAGVLLAASLWALLRRRPAAPLAGTVPGWLPLAVAVLTGCALAALGVLAWSLLGEALGWAKPERAKPFFETLERWSGGVELAALRRAFAQWEVDPYVLNRWLAPLAVALGLVGGHTFLLWLPRARRWVCTGSATLAALVAAFWWQPFERLFRGEGMTSGQTVAHFPVLDALALALLYLGATALAWSLRLLHRRRVSGYGVASGLVHAGVVISLLAALGATVFDGYAQRFLRYPQDFAQPIELPGGYRLRIELPQLEAVADGGRGGGVRSVARVGWELHEDGLVLESATGHAVYRSGLDGVADAGAVRLMCEMLDYRYARTQSGDRLMIHPFIHRGLWRDVQVWVPVAGRGDEVPVILKIYPLLSWLWLGLALLFGAAAWCARCAWRS